MKQNQAETAALGFQDSTGKGLELGDRTRASGSAGARFNPQYLQLKGSQLEGAVK